MTPRYFLLPIIALIVIGSLPAPSDAARAGTTGAGCGPALSSIADPALKTSFEDLERTQSAAAAKICSLYRNSMDAVAR